MSTWEIQYPASGSPTIKTFEAWGISDASRARVSQAAEIMTFKRDGYGSLEPRVFDWEENLIVYRDGVPYFFGKVVPCGDKEPAASMTQEYKVANPWWWLENIPCRAELKVWDPTAGGGAGAVVTATNTRLLTGQSLAGLVQDTADSVRAVLEYAISKGAPIQIGRIDPGVIAFMQEMLDKMCSEVIIALLKWTPDAMIKWDYTTTVMGDIVPTIHVLRPRTMPVLREVKTSSAASYEALSADGDYLGVLDHGGALVELWLMSPGASAPVAPGVGGNSLIVASGPPAGGTGADGDYYQDSLTHACYKKAAGAWSMVCVHIKTSRRYFWATDVNAVWRTGAADPTPSDGKDNDLWLNTVSQELFRKSGGAWASICADVTVEFDFVTINGQPEDAFNADGKLFCDIDTDDVWVRAAGVYVLLGNRANAQRTVTMHDVTPRHDMRANGVHITYEKTSTVNQDTYVTNEYDVYPPGTVPGLKIKEHTVRLSGAQTTVQRQKVEAEAIANDTDDWWVARAPGLTQYSNRSYTCALIVKVPGAGDTPIPFMHKVARGAPPNNLGSDDDWAIDASTGNVYEKVSGAWAARAAPVDYALQDIPASGFGSNGQFALVAPIGTVYQKNAGAWEIKASTKFFGKVLTTDYPNELVGGAVPAWADALVVPMGMIKSVRACAAAVLSFTRPSATNVPIDTPANNGAQRTTNVTTITSVGHGLATGDKVMVQGVDDGAGTFDHTFDTLGTVITVIDADHFSYPNTGADSVANTRGNGSVTLLSTMRVIAYLDITATTLTTQEYVGVTAYTAAEPTPVGLAQSIFEILNVLRYDGSWSFAAEECDDLIEPGVLLNLENGRAEWRHMLTTTQATHESIMFGTTECTFGAPKHLSIQDMIESLRAVRGRIVSYRVGERVDARATGQGGQVEGGVRTPYMNAMVGEIEVL